MNYDVAILDKPFIQKIKLRNFREIIVNTPKTAQITYLDIESTERVFEYGYKSPEEINAVIDKKEPLNLDGCFVNKIDFQDCELQYLRASGALFSENVDFTSARFRTIGNFSAATFLGNATFRYARFYGDADFSYVNCIGSLRFTNAKLLSDVTFLGAELYQLNFVGAHIGENFRCLGVKIKDKAILSGITFGGDVKFEAAYIYKSIDFIGAKFYSHAYLTFFKCDNMTLRDCIFDQACTISNPSGFDTLNIHGCMTSAPFSIPYSAELKKAIQNQEFNNTDTVSMKNRILAQQFNFLKVAYNRNGEYTEEDQAYIEYRRCMRKARNPIICFFDWVFLDGISCYCTKPFRVFGVALGMIVAFAIIFFLSIQLSFLPDTITFGKNYQGFWGSLYHSVITFFTIGYGDSQPIGKLGLFLTGLEGFVGVFLMSLFTVSFVRKVLR